MSKCRVRFRVRDHPGLVFRIGNVNGLVMRIGAPLTNVEIPAYEGSYTVIPGTVAQVLQTAGKSMAENVTVGPIPQNYGLITWNGTVITVS